MIGTSLQVWRRRFGRYVTGAVVCAVVGGPATVPAEAQTPSLPAALISAVPPSLLLPNYNRVLIGEKEALEAAAFVARAEGSVAAYYNPAGLGLADATRLTVGLATQEWMRYSVTGDSQATSRTSNRSIGGVFGLVLGPELSGLEKWRFGFLIMRPLAIQPALELRATVPSDGGRTAGTYLTTSSLSDLAPTVAAAYNYSPTLRFGASVRLSSLSLYQNQALFADVLNGNTLRTAEGTLVGHGSVLSLVFTGGLQWEPRPRVRIGAQIALPSLRMAGSSSVIYRGADLSAGYGVIEQFADASTEFRYRQPFNVSGGVAWTSDRGQVEFDIKHYASTRRYDLLKSDQFVERTVVSNVGTVVETIPFPTFTFAGRAVTNVALGGHYRFSEAVTAHAGVYSDRSPVGPGAESLFGHVNLSGVTAGAAFRFSRVVGSVGLAWVSGKQEVTLDLPFRQVSPTVRVRSLQLLYALSLTF